MKNLLTMCVVVGLMVTASIAQGQSKNDKAILFAGKKIVGEKKVTAAIAITEIPEELAVFKKSGFSKYVSVFGIHCVATPKARDEKLLQATKVMAEYLDNDSDGVPDNMLVLSHLLSRKAYLVFPRTPDELEGMDRDQWQDAGFHAGQSQWDEETRPDFIKDGVINPEVGQDASIEEVLHLLCVGGWSAAYPDIFGYEGGSAMADCMDIARAGHYEEVPTGGPKAGYPEEAWYHYDDTTCNYACMAIEYMYWGLTSILGGQDYPERARSISVEWAPYSRELMSTMDTCLYDLLTDPKYGLPTKLPEGDYSPSATPTITVPLIAYTQSETEPS